MISIRLSFKRAFYDLLVGGDVEEEVLVLGRGVLRAVRAWVAEHHEERLVRAGGLGLGEELQGPVRDQVGELVLK